MIILKKKLIYRKMVYGNFFPLLYIYIFLFLFIMYVHWCASFFLNIRFFEICVSEIPGLEVWNRNFFAKVTRLLHENDQKYFIQSNLHCYLHIFSTSPEGDECHANKTVRLLNQTSYPAILVHFRTKWSVV